MVIFIHCSCWSEVANNLMSFSAQCLLVSVIEGNQCDEYNITKSLLLKKFTFKIVLVNNYIVCLDKGSIPKTF